MRSFLPIIIYKVLKPIRWDCGRNRKFLTHHNLQGSQTGHIAHTCDTLFLTHHNLQGSQTIYSRADSPTPFLTHHNLQGSQTYHKLNGVTI